MYLYDSFVRLTFDPAGAAVVLVDIGDPMWTPMSLDGGQVVEVASFVRAAGISAIPRANEQHQMSFATARIMDTMEDAFASRLNGSITLPRYMADVLISLTDGRQWRLKNCAVKSWKTAQDECISRESIEITGGQLIVDPGSYYPSDYWNTDPATWDS